MNRTMKKLLTTLLIGFVLPLFIGANIALSAEGDYSKTIKKEYNVEKDALLIVKNKYGKVHCNNWEKDAISIEVIIKVDAPSEDKANKILDKIDVKISGNSSEVSAVTEFRKGWCDEKVCKELSIDFIIYMPNTVELDIEHKFGELYIDETSGSARLSIGYGTMEVRKLLNDDNDLKIKFSEASVDYLGGGLLELQYSSFDLSETHDLTVDSKFSSVSIEKLNACEIESQYDEFSIGAITSIILDSKFSDFKISKLLDKAEIENQYGGITIKYVKRGFSEINIENSFGGIDIGIDEEASYSIDAVVKFGSLSYPKNISTISTEVEGYTTNIYNGSVGSDKNSSSIITIESKNAGVSLTAW